MDMPDMPEDGSCQSCTRLPEIPDRDVPPDAADGGVDDLEIGMKTTRRNLLRFIGLGAAAAALAPAVSVETASAAEPIYRAVMQDNGLVHIANQHGAIFAGAPTPEMLDMVDAAYKGMFGQEWFDGLPERLPSDAVAQARADGYNRGREVEMARAESRHVHHASPECLGCIYDAQLPPAEHQAALERYEARTSIGGAVSGEMARQESRSQDPYTAERVRRYTEAFDPERHGDLDGHPYVYLAEPDIQMPPAAYLDGTVRGAMGSGPVTMQQAAAWVDPKAEADFLKWIEG